MPALPLDDARPLHHGAYLVFLALILIYVAIIACKLVRIERELVGSADDGGGPPRGRRLRRGGSTQAEGVPRRPPR